MVEHQQDEPLDAPAGSPESEGELVSRELTRLIEGAGASSGGAEFFTILPLVSDADAVAFFRTVPTGTPLDKLPQRAAAWRAAHPPRGCASGDRG